MHVKRFSLIENFILVQKTKIYTKIYKKFPNLYKHINFNIY